MMEQLPQDWPLWAIIVYLFIKDAVPVIGEVIGKVASLSIPARAKKAADEMEHQMELEAQRLDLREREVIALEQIGKSLAIIDTRIQVQDKNLTAVLSGISVANNALVVILDRVHRRREDYVQGLSPAPMSEATPSTPTSD